MTTHEELVRSDPEIMGGTPCFAGTRVPIRAMFDYIAGGHPLADFLDDFPTVSKEHAIGVLKLADHFWPVMHVLLDECLPKQLWRSLKGHIAWTVQQKGWSGKRNGELLSLMSSNGFQVLLTADQSIVNQQNLKQRGSRSS